MCILHTKNQLYYHLEVREMFKVSKPEMVNKTFRMPAELVERLNIVAQEQKVSLNNLVCQCCEYALSNMSETSENEE